jgi:hypothetical protein
LEAIRELGARVADAWLERDLRSADFAPIAVAALESSRILERVGRRELDAWFLQASDLPEQSFRNFGQPALTLFRGPRFYIELLVWLESTTAIHQHSFAGAFGVLSGSSLHSRYRFTATDRRKPEIVFGALRLDDAEVLTRGDVRAITPGDGLIHSLFHLDHPTLSLVVRTETIASCQPQYSYYRSGIGHDPLFAPEPFSTRIRLLESLRQADDPDFWPHALDAMGRADCWMALAILNIAHKSHERAQAWAELVRAARARLGERAGLLLAAIEERARERLIVDRRRDVRDPDLRFFLALLLNLPDRQAIFGAIRQRFPDADAEDRVVEWVAALGRHDALGFTLDALGLEILRYALRDLPLAAARRELERVFGEAAVAGEAAALERLWNGIVRDPALAPLFVGGPALATPGAAREEEASCRASG